MNKKQNLIVFLVYLLSLIAILGLFRAMLGDMQSKLVSERTENLGLRFTIVDLRHNISDLKVDLFYSELISNDTYQQLLDVKSDRTFWQDKYYETYWQMVVQEDRANEGWSNLAFLQVADNLSRQHGYVKNEYDCTDFSDSCVSAWKSMGYLAHTKVLTIGCDTGQPECASSAKHQIGIIEIPVECTPPNVHIIQPYETWYQGLWFDP
jgi:hypothetical protein